LGPSDPIHEDDLMSVDVVKMNLSGMGAGADIGYLDLIGAAQFLAISKRSVRRLVQSGFITYYRVPGTRKIRFRPKDLHFYMNRGRCRGVTELIESGV